MQQQKTELLRADLKQAKHTDPYAGGTVCLVVHTFEILILPVLAFNTIGVIFRGNSEIRTYSEISSNQTFQHGIRA